MKGQLPYCARQVMADARSGQKRADPQPDCQLGHYRKDNPVDHTERRDSDGTYSPWTPEAFELFFAYARVDLAGYGYLEVKCLGCSTHQTVALDVVRRPKTTPVHELERYLRCKDCSQVRRYAFKRSQLVALRPNKITADSPASTKWPGDRD
jgi:hypothetical protein